jgi:hypothetical protein
MRNEQPDKEKLISLASLIRKEFGLVVQREAILTFSREDDSFIGFQSWLNEEQFKKYIIHVPDLLFFVNGVLWIMEIDGYIHYVKNSVMIKDEERDRIYDAAKLNWKKINEWEVLIKHGKKPNRSATVKEIWPEVKCFVQKLV